MSSAWTLYHIEAPHLGAGVLVDPHTQYVVQSAPILGWARGRPWADVERYCKRRGWKVRQLPGIAAPDLEAKP